jgi:hypothetical protein
VFLLTTFAQINNDVVEFVSAFVRDFSDAWDLFAIKVFFEVLNVSFEFNFDCVCTFADFVDRFFDVSDTSANFDWID